MNKKYKGILYIVVSAFCFALMNLFVRMAGDLPSIQKSFFRNFVAAIFACVILLKENIPFRCKRENLIYLVLRAVFGTVGILCNFYAIDHLVLADASMLNKMSPFFAVIFSFLILKEKVTVPQALFVAGAFLGSLFVIKPTFANMNLFPSVLGLLGGIGAGAAYTMVRKLGERGEKGPFIVFFFSAFSCLATLPWLIFDYHPMSAAQLITLLLAGLAAAGGQRHTFMRRHGKSRFTIIRRFYFRRLWASCSSVRFQMYSAGWATESYAGWLCSCSFIIKKSFVPRGKKTISPGGNTRCPPGEKDAGLTFPDFLGILNEQIEK